MKKPVKGPHNYSYHRHIGVLFFYLTFGLFVAMFVISRFTLTNKVVAAKLVIQAIFIDLAMAVFIALLTKLFYRIHIALSAVILIFSCIFLIANMEMVAALNTYINFNDLH